MAPIVSNPENEGVSRSIDEESLLLGRSFSRSTVNSKNHGHDTDDQNDDSAPTSSPAALISLLLVGVFIANADTSLVLATNNTIASSFASLPLAPWLTTAYLMSICCSQPIIGSLSTIYSRKSILLLCYVIFSMGSAMCALGRSMAEVIAGRAIQGMGGAGMTVVVSVLITDLVGIREVAAWRSYVNIFATTGRMVGGPLGGWLADFVGWRWSFMGQVPLMVIAIVLVWWKLDDRTGESDEHDDSSVKSSKLEKVDFVGAILLSGSIITFLLGIDSLGHITTFSATLHRILPLLLVSSAFLLTFLAYESRYASAPLFPPALLLHRSVWTSYLSVGLQAGAQVSLMFSVPLYYQAVSGASNAVAGSRLLPAFAGNTVGSLVTGYYIKASGRYKNAIILGCVAGAATYLTVIFRWSGEINAWESLEIFPGGFGTGVVIASSFIAMTAGLDHEDVAIATGGFYLVNSLGQVVGVGVSSGIQRAALTSLLYERLDGKDDREIIEGVLANVDFIKTLTGRTKDLVVKSFVDSLEFSHGFSLTCSIIALLVALCVRELRLQ